MNIKITIDAPELAGALESLALAISGAGIALPTVPVTVSTPATTKQETKATDKPKADTKKQDAPVATKTMYFSHSESDSVFIVEKGEEIVQNELVEEITKAEYTRLKALQEAPVQEEPKQEPEENTKAEQLITLEVVRGKLAEFSAGGKDKQTQVMDALSRFGVKKLTDVEPTDYKELLELVGLSA